MGDFHTELTIWSDTDIDGDAFNIFERNPINDPNANSKN